MKKSIVKTTIIALCFLFCGARATKTIKSYYKSARLDYFKSAKGKAQGFIISSIE